MQEIQVLNIVKEEIILRELYSISFSILREILIKFRKSYLLKMI